jgi:glycosyltransferase involved in cell wall biosynthesis
VTGEQATLPRPAASSRDGRAATQHAASGSVAILLCTYNGARFLPLQLASFEAQTVEDWRLFVSDDGSTDDTLAVLKAFQAKHGPERVQIRCGPGRGFVANFMSLVCDPALRSDFYALSDQDDVWAPDKLARARAFVMSVPDDTPAFYCSRARMIDDAGNEIGFTPLYRKAPDFRNALVQNIAIGNTMMLNESTRRLLMRAGADVKAAVHDWWMYLAITAVGGRIYFDPYPSVAYRIHASNLIGSTDSRWRRAQALLDRFKTWNDLNIDALTRIEGEMLPENRQIFELFRQSRTRGLLPRIIGFIRSGVYRETFKENIELAVAALSGKI